jgi:hypothetical protein
VVFASRYIYVLFEQKTEEDEEAEYKEANKSEAKTKVASYNGALKNVDMNRNDMLAAVDSVHSMGNGDEEDEDDIPGAVTNNAPRRNFQQAVKLTAAQKLAMQRSKSVGAFSPFVAEPLAPLKALPPIPPTLMKNLPSKNSRWTKQFRATQKSSDNVAFRWTRYHKLQLAIQLGKRLRARGVREIEKPDGKMVDFLTLLENDPKAAGNLAVEIANVITVAAKSTHQSMSFEQAAATIDSAKDIESGNRTAAAGYEDVASVLPKDAQAASNDKTVLEILPQESWKPIANCLTVLGRWLGYIGPVYSKIMHFL